VVPLRTCTDERVRAGSRNWLRVRNTGIGASEIATALGIGNPNWGSPYELYQRKRGELIDVRDNAAMEWGRNLEATIIKRFLKCHPEFRDNPCLTGRLYRSKERAWQLATPDAVVFDTRPMFMQDRLPAPLLRVNNSYAVPVVVQVKTGSKREGWGEEGSDEIPVYYRAQVLQEMDVVGADVAWVPVLFNGREYREYRVRRHERDLNVLRTRGADFWRRVEEGNPPPVDGSVASLRALRDLGLEPEKQAQVPLELAQKLARAKRLVDRTEALHDRIEAQLREAMGDAEVAMAGTQLLAKRTRYMARRIDVNRLREEAPDIAEKYTTPREVNRLNTYTKEIL
jgi:putative phage-type endonuclease